MNDLHTFLEAARRRRWVQIVLRQAAGGLVKGCTLALVVGAVFLIWPGEHGKVWIGAAVAAGLVWGILRGLASKPTLALTARAIDRRAGLKDRVATALQLASMDTADAYSLLQQGDAVRWLRRQRVERLFPWRWPAEGSWAAIGLVLAGGAILLVPRPEPAEARSVGPARAVTVESQELAAEIEQLLEQMKESANDPQNKDLKSLAEQLPRMMSQLQEQARTPEEAMLKMAEMTAAMQQAAAGFDTQLLQQALREMGEGMRPLAGFEPAAEQLKQGDYEKAAKALEQLGQRIGSGETPMLPSGGLIESRLGQLAQQAASAGTKELAESLQQLREAVRNGSRGECQGGLNRVASVVRKYGQRAKVGASLSRQLASLSEHKQCLTCQGGYCKNCRGEGKGECEGGNCRGIKMGQASLTMNKSSKPSSSAGTAIAADKFDKATDLRGNRSREQVTGQMGEGDSDTETETATEGEQSAGRQYREVYAKYRKISEQAMAEEAVPLGHRQIIKRYFELIHPDRVETAGTTDKVTK